MRKFFQCCSIGPLHFIETHLKFKQLDTDTYEKNFSDTQYNLNAKKVSDHVEWKYKSNMIYVKKCVEIN